MDKKYLAINFLGSILKDPVPLICASLEKDSLKTPGYIEERDIPSNSLTGLAEKNNLSLLFEKETLNPDNIVTLDSSKKEKVSFASAFSEDCVSAQREVTFRPPFPEYPGWMQEYIVRGFAVFNVRVSADGLVQEVVNLQITASAELDVALSRYVKGWRFAPVFDGNDHWQTVKIELNFENNIEK